MRLGENETRLKRAAAGVAMRCGSADSKRTRSDGRTQAASARHTLSVWAHLQRSCQGSRHPPVSVSLETGLWTDLCAQVSAHAVVVKREKERESGRRAEYGSG
eukprot:6127114-Pleurochrysis_carterae.AAC.1